MNKKSFGIALSAGILGLSVLTGANAADPKPQDAAKYRQSVYTIIGWNFKPIGAMIKGEIPFDAAAVARHAIAARGTAVEIFRFINKEFICGCLLFPRPFGIDAD